MSSARFDLDGGSEGSVLFANVFLSRVSECGAVFEGVWRGAFVVV